MTRLVEGKQLFYLDMTMRWRFLVPIGIGTQNNNPEKEGRGHMSHPFFLELFVEV